MQLSLAFRINHALLIQTGRERIQVQELEHALLVHVFHKSKDSPFNVRRKIVLVAHNIRHKAVALHHLVAHVLEIYHVDALVQGRNGTGDTVLVFLVAVLLVDNDIAGIDAPEMVGNAIAQVVSGNANRNGFNRIASHHRDEPIQRIMEIETVEGTEIAYQHIRHQNHHVVHGDAYEVDVLLAIEQAHHGH